MELLARAKAHYLAAVSLFMAHNDVRYYLNGISIEPASQGGVLLIATNGHHIGVMHDPDGWAGNKIIISPSKALVAGLKKRNAGTAFIYERAGVISDSDNIMTGTKVVQLSQILDTPDFCHQFIELARKTLECRDMQIRARVQLWNDDGTPVLTKKRKHKVEWQQFGHQPGRAAA
ncbi:TPA: hypothetical protein U8215_000825 [Pseudomonas aeruginosa]|nr:hypothetical protein [Pseudomonas aeruginosa]HEN8744237.1 hypothetical protein [Pseudomonas aeruginosa]HEN8833685.1 hypothetical protein [Pseudomonas aeruginosa]